VCGGTASSTVSGERPGVMTRANVSADAGARPGRGDGLSRAPTQLSGTLPLVMDQEAVRMRVACRGGDRDGSDPDCVRDGAGRGDHHDGKLTRIQYVHPDRHPSQLPSAMTVGPPEDRGPVEIRGESAIPVRSLRSAPRSSSCGCQSRRSGYGRSRQPKRGLSTCRD
jgi:hypothetical protein